MSLRGPAGPRAAAFAGSAVSGFDGDPGSALTDEAALIGAAGALLAAADGGEISAAERSLLRRAAAPPPALTEALRAAVLNGGDPLGDAFSRIRPPARRRAFGQVFTPWAIVDHMADAAAATATAAGTAFAQAVDCGMGSGRYLRAAAARFPQARLIGVEIDPLCALIGRAALAAAGLGGRCDILLQDFRSVVLPETAGPRLFIGNPPYVRHHAIDEGWKAWYADSVAAHGLPRPSKLAGLHLHFFARVAELARPGDAGVFVTAAEWLDTGYGAALRRLLLGPLGGRSVTTVAASAQPFPDAMTTAAVTLFAPHLPTDGLTIGETDDPARLADAPGAHYAADDPALLLGRWSLLTRGRPAAAPPPKGHVGDLFRVSRGQVTGCNAAFVVGPDAPPLPARFLLPCVTGADQIFAAAERGEGRLTAAGPLGRVVCLPKQLNDLPAAEARQVKHFLDWARALGAESSYTARHRNPWWRVAPGEPAPILMSYMARRAPAFVRNDAGAAIINVAHGLRPKTSMTAAELDAAAAALNAAVASAVGRIYAGGLVKFEPRAVEQIPIDWAAAGLGRALDALKPPPQKPAPQKPAKKRPAP